MLHGCFAFGAKVLLFRKAGTALISGVQIHRGQSESVIVQQMLLPISEHTLEQERDEIVNESNNAVLPPADYSMALEALRLNSIEPPMIQLFAC